MKSKLLLLVLFILVAFVSFWIGTRYQKIQDDMWLSKNLDIAQLKALFDSTK